MGWGCRGVELWGVDRIFKDVNILGFFGLEFGLELVYRYVGYCYFYFIYYNW